MPMEHSKYTPMEHTPNICPWNTLNICPWNPLNICLWNTPNIYPWSTPNICPWNTPNMYPWNTPNIRPWNTPNTRPWNTSYTFCSLKLRKWTSRGNRNKLMICIYLCIHVPLLEAHHTGSRNIWAYFRGFTVYISEIYVPIINHSEKWSFFEIPGMESMLEFFKKCL